MDLLPRLDFSTLCSDSRCFSNFDTAGGLVVEPCLCGGFCSVSSASCATVRQGTPCSVLEFHVNCILLDSLLSMLYRFHIQPNPDVTTPSLNAHSSPWTEIPYLLFRFTFYTTAECVERTVALYGGLIVPPFQL